MILAGKGRDLRGREGQKGTNEEEERKLKGWDWELQKGQKRERLGFQEDIYTLSSLRQEDIYVFFHSLFPRLPFGFPTIYVIAIVGSRVQTGSKLKKKAQ